MKNLAYFKKAKSEKEESLSNLNNELETMLQNLEDLEEKATDAIDAEDRATLESVTEKISALNNKIDAQKRIIARKEEKDAFTEEDLRNASNAEMVLFQREFNTARAEAENYLEQYFKKMIEAGKILETANQTRLEYMKMAGIENLYITGVENHNFHYLRSEYKRPAFSLYEEGIIQKIDPRGLYYINTQRN